MKKIIFIVGIFVLIVLCLNLLPKTETENSYLRLHIKSNSNLEIDQNVKFEIKDNILNFLTPLFCNVNNKDEAILVFNKNKGEVNKIVIETINKNGLKYNATINFNNEYFPARNYNSVTLNSGYYDAITINLGDANGDNWWCVMYPPLCFASSKKNSVNFKSKIQEMWQKLF